MDCKKYKSLYEIFTDFPLPFEITDSDDYLDWHEHGHECLECKEWNMGKEVEKNGDKPANHPCIHLAYHSQHNCQDHKDPFECPDTTLVKINDRYGIPVRNGGSSFVEIKNCPWCGIRIK